MSFCDSCNERVIKKGLENESVRNCESCVKSRTKYLGVSMLSKENDLDPFKKGYPHHLPKLNTIEELIISKVFVVMRE